MPAYRSKRGVVLVICATVILLSAWTAVRNPIEKGPYILRYPANFGNRYTIPAENATTKEGVYLGRILFYENRLSATNKISCGSCHQQALAFTDGKAFSEGINAQLTDRNSMSLVNLLWTKRFFWDGRATGLEAQATIPLQHPREMGQSLSISAKKLSQDTRYRRLFKLVFGDERITGDRIVKAISQFERTLISAGSPYDQYLQNNYTPDSTELKGIALFATHCDRCHGGVKTYAELFHNNGLDSNSNSKDTGIAALTGLETDRGRFKVPTLRNIELTAPYMHDGRFTSLEQVLDHYSDHIINTPSLSASLRGNLNLQPKEKTAIIAFLKLLTDTAFINNPQFADPNIIKTKYSSALNKTIKPNPNPKSK